MKEIGLIGFGSFGQFITPILSKYFKLSVFDFVDKRIEANHLGVKFSTLDDVASKEYLIFCVPVQFLEPVLVQIASKVQSKAVCIDVSSVKVKPIALMNKYLPKSVEIVGTHPLFGPQSGKNGIKDLNIVLCPVRTNKIRNFERFFLRELNLNVLVRTPELHDQQMAYVQALTHFIGRAVNGMDIPDVEQKTPAYQYLLNIKRNLGADSMDLFETIENGNPYAKEVRDNFMDALKNIDDSLIKKS